MARKLSTFYQFIEHDNSNTLTVIFSSIGQPSGTFSFWKHGKALNSHLIFFNCPEAHWYRAGIPGIDGDIRGVKEEIQAFKQTVQAHRLVMIGNSMGAYGALLYGTLTKADQILCFGAEPLLGIPGGRTNITRNHLQYVHPDLTQLKIPPTAVFYGGMEASDVLGAWLLRSRNGAEVMCIRDAQHDSPEFLFRRGQLSAIFNDLVIGKSINRVGYDEGDAGVDSTIKLLWRINGFIHEKKWQEIGSVLTEEHAITATSPLLSYLNGITHFKCNRLEIALYTFTELLKTVPGFWELWLNIGSCHIKLKNYQKAIDALWHSISLKPHRSISHFQLANAYWLAGETEKCLFHAEWACKLNPLKQPYFDKLKQFCTTMNRNILDRDHLIREQVQNIITAKQWFDGIKPSVQSTLNP